MDVLDHADGHFFRRYFPDALRYACLGAGIPYHRTSGFFNDSDHTGYAVLFRIIGQRLYSSRMARINGFGAVDRVDYISWLGDYRHALGVIRCLETFHRALIAHICLSRFFHINSDT